MQGLFNSIIAALFGAAIAYFGWCFDPQTVLITSLIFFSYFFLNQRKILFILLFSYHLYSSFGLFSGLINFYDFDYVAAFILWSTSAFLSALPWIIIWSKSFKKRLWLFPIALAVVTLPPFGFITWVNPIISAAVLFPHTGYLGLLFFLLFIYLLVILTDIYLKKYSLFITTLFVATITFLIPTPATIAQNDLVALDTNFNFKNNTVIDEYKRQKKILHLASNSPTKNLLLPEHILGTFTESSMMVWKDLPKDKTIFAGASIPIPNSSKYQNVLMSINSNEYKILYSQRVPVPIEMWKPFQKKGATASIFSTGPAIIKTKKVGVFICYEQYLTYLYLDTMLDDPDYILGISNLWWITDPTLKNIQKHSLFLWSQLFNIPFIYSANT